MMRKVLFANCTMALLLGCASMSKRDTTLKEGRTESLKEEISPAVDAKRDFKGAATESVNNAEVRILSIDRVVTGARKKPPKAPQGLGNPNAEGIDASLGLKSRSRTKKGSSRSATNSPLSARGTQSNCSEVLGGDYWAERVRVDPSLQRFFQAQSRVPFEVSVYRRVSSSPEEFARVFHMDEAARRVSFVVETPRQRREASDFLYEIQLLNRSDETAEYCLKHW